MCAGLIFQRQTSKKPYLLFKSEIVGLGTKRVIIIRISKAVYHGDYSGPAANFNFVIPISIFIGFAVSMMWFGGDGW